MSRKVELSKVKLNAIIGYIFFALYALANFVMSPILVQYLGVSHFGIWKTAGRFFEFANLADGRSSQALKWIIANKQVNSTDSERKQFIGAAYKIWLRFIPLVLVVLTTMVFYFPIFAKGVKQSEIELIMGVGLILATNILIMPLWEIPEAVLIGTNNGYWAKSIQIFYLFILNLAMYLLLTNGYGLLALSLAFLTSTVLIVLTMGLLAKIRIQWFSVKKPNKKQISEFWKFSGWVWSWVMIEKLLLVSDLMLFVFLIGVSFVTAYSFSSFVALFGLSITLMMGSAMTPYIARLRSEGNSIDLEKTVKFCRELALYLVLLIAGGILVLNQSFVELWAGKEFYLGNKLNLLIALSFIQIALIRNEAQIHDVGLQIKNRVLLGGFGIFLGGGLAILLFTYIKQDPVWVLTGLIGGRLIMSVIFPILVVKSFGGAISIHRYLLGGIILYFCYHFGATSCGSWVDFIYAAGIIFILLSITFIPIVFSKHSLSVLGRFFIARIFP